MATTILQGDVFDTLPTLEAGSVDCALYSPPYWRLRDYSTCSCVKNRKKKPGCPQCDDHGKIPVVRDKQLGMEKTPEEYVENQVAVARLVRRALADHGTCWINIGDSYAAGGRQGHGVRQGYKQQTNAGTLGCDERANADLVSGNLCLIPQRLTLALQNDGWIVRSIVVWKKKAPMPASLSGWRWVRCRVKVKAGKSPARNLNPKLRRVGEGLDLPKVASAFPDAAQWTDCPGCKKCNPQGYVLSRGSWRPTSSWEPILLLAKSDRYFCDGEAVKQPAASTTLARDRYTRVLDDPEEQFAVKHDHETESSSGANPRDVRDFVPSKADILAHLETLTEEELQAMFCASGSDNALDVQTWGAEPLKEAHYAAFPTDLVEFCLRAGTSAKGYCPACGAPWCRVVEVKNGSLDNGVRNVGHREDGFTQPRWKTGEPRVPSETKTLSWRPSCVCIGAAAMMPRRGRVLDPFCGSSRSGVEAARLGLDFVGCELNPDFCTMSRRILTRQNPLFNEVTID
jgi:DNA modification methylase